MSQETFNQKELDTFQWDQSVEEVDFFGEVTKNPSKVAAEDAEKEKDKEKEEPEVIDFFGDTGIEDDPEGKDDPEGDADKADKLDKDEDGDKPAVLSNVGVASFLKDKGLIDFELEEGTELEEDDAEALIEEGFETSVENKVGVLMAALPDSVKNLVKFAMNGGDPDEYLSTISKSSAKGVTGKMDITKESNQEEFMKFKLAGEGNDEEYIEAQIEFLKDSGKLDSIATKAFNNWKSKEDERAAELVEQQKQQVAQTKKNQLEYKREISEHLSEIENINNLKFTKKDQKDLPEYIGDNSVTLEDGRKITPFYRDLFASMKDKNKLAVLAKLVKNNFDFKDIETAIATKQARNVKEDIQRQKTGKKLNTASGSSQPKRLADYFNN